MQQLNQDQLLSSYNFELPVDAIAQRPLEPRHRARMLKVEGGGQGCSHLKVWDLAQQLCKGDLLVVNNTRVLRARLKARRAADDLERARRVGGAYERAPHAASSANPSAMKEAIPAPVSPSIGVSSRRPAFINTVTRVPSRLNGSTSRIVA